MARQRSASLLINAVALLVCADLVGCIQIVDISRLARSRISQPDIIAAVTPPVIQEQFDGLWGAWSSLRSMVWGSAVEEGAVNLSGAVRTMSYIAEQLDRHLAAKEYDRALSLLDPRIEWQTPQWRAVGRAAVKETWASGIDAKWGVTPVWRKVTAGGTGLVFVRECDTFRVMGWPIRLRQTFHVRKKGFGFVVLKAVTERL